MIALNKIYIPFFYLLTLGVSFAFLERLGLNISSIFLVFEIKEVISIAALFFMIIGHICMLII